MKETPRSDLIGKLLCFFGLHNNRVSSCEGLYGTGWFGWTCVRCGHKTTDHRLTHNGNS